MIFNFYLLLLITYLNTIEYNEKKNIFSKKFYKKTGQSKLKFEDVKTYPVIA